MKKKAIFFNSPYLGGAERSMVQQLYLLNIKEQVSVYIPYFEDISEAEDLIELISTTLRNVEIKFYKYPKSLFSVSRSGTNKLSLIFIAIRFFFFSFSLKINQYNVIWANGNKVALPIFLNLFLKGRDNKVIWHFRDYPSPSIFMTVAKFLMKRSKKMRVFCIGNSLDVSREIDRVLDISISNYAYNPVGDFMRKPFFPKKSYVIGSASMLAPWKGIHQLIMMANIYYSELKSLGVGSIQIFGGDIYKTEGEHINYKEQILELAKANNLIEFKGLAKPQEVFQSLDIIVHTSERAEPFGRIIVEAYKAGTCLISTGLGGSGEIIERNKTGLIYQSYDYSDLFFQIKNYLENPELQKRIYDFSFHKASNLDALAKNQIVSFLELVENS